MCAAAPLVSLFKPTLLDRHAHRAYIYIQDSLSRVYALITNYIVYCCFVHLSGGNDQVNLFIFFFFALRQYIYRSNYYQSIIAWKHAYFYAHKRFVITTTDLSGWFELYLCNYSYIAFFSPPRLMCFWSIYDVNSGCIIIYLYIVSLLLLFFIILP